MHGRAFLSRMGGSICLLWDANARVSPYTKEAELQRRQREEPVYYGCEDSEQDEVVPLVRWDRMKRHDSET